MLVYRFETFNHDGIWCPSNKNNRVGGTPCNRAAAFLRTINKLFPNPGLDYEEYEHFEEVSFLEYMDDKIPHPRNERWGITNTQYYECLDSKSTRFAFHDFERVRTSVGLNHRRIPKEIIHEQYRILINTQRLALWLYDVPDGKVLAKTESQLMFQRDPKLKPIGMFHELKKKSITKV